MRSTQEKQVALPLGSGVAGAGVGSSHERDLKRAISTGIEAVDRLLPSGGMVCGHLTQMVGPRGSGRTTFVVSAVGQVASRGERSAIIDLEGDLDPSALVWAGIPPRLVWVISAVRTDEAMWAADLLLRSGHFRLVVLDGLEGGVRTAAWVRLQRQARESDAVLLVGADRWPVSAPGSLRLHFRPLGVDWDEGLGASAGPKGLRFSVEVGKGQREAAVRIACRPRSLLGRHEGIPDRRPAAWTEDGGVGPRAARVPVPNPDYL